MNMRLTSPTISALFLGIVTARVFGLGLHRRSRFCRNCEQEDYDRANPFAVTASIVDGLAVYRGGDGEAVLLFPYPRSHTTEPMALSPLALALREMNRKVVTFDVSGAYRSTREPVGDVQEMIESADETFDRLGIQGPIDAVGHSMGGLAALAYSMERPARVKRLVLVSSLSGFPAAARWGLPGSVFPLYQLDYWRVIIWGVCLTLGRGNLELHKRLANRMGRVSFYNETFFRPVQIHVDDYKRDVPVRTIWSRNMYSRLDYTDGLAQVGAPTLILAGRHDPQTPLPCAHELFQGISDSALVVFEQSGHFPFIEEPVLFAQEVTRFFDKRDDEKRNNADNISVVCTA